MSTHKHFDKICCLVLVLTLILTLLFINGKSLGVQASMAELGYESRIFDTSRVHTIDILMDDWDSFLSTCTDEKYTDCTVVIDGEAYKNTAIRAKGNTSLTQVEAYGNNRYSFKLEFDHYNSQQTYYGLDKLCLNNMVQDNTYLKDYLTYQMMAQMGTAAPLCSFVTISVNGESWGLYLAVEAIEESFLLRNYGEDYGCLYKPDTMDMGGGFAGGNIPEGDFAGGGNMPGGFGGENMPDGGFAGGNMPGGFGGENMPDGGFGGGNMPGGDFSGQENMPGTVQQQGPGGLSSDDLLLKYIDDDPDSYGNIFDNGKTQITTADQERLIASLKRLGSNEELSQTVDLDQVIRYFVVHNFVLNFDSYTGSMIHNYYLYEKDGVLSMLPWDYNLAFGGFSTGTDVSTLVNFPIDSPVLGGDLADRPMLSWIFSNEEYTKLYHQYMGELITEFFDSGSFSRQMDELKELLSPYVAEDPTKFCSYEEFEKGVAALEKFCLLRSESIGLQLEGALGTTFDTQDSSSFVSAGDLELSDMGSMNLSGKHMGDTSDKSAENPREQEQNHIPGDRNDPFAQKDASAPSWPLLAVSLAVLAVGLVFALLYRKGR